MEKKKLELLIDELAIPEVGFDFESREGNEEESTNSDLDPMAIPLPPSEKTHKEK